MRGRVVQDWNASFPDGVVFSPGDRVRLEKFDPDWPGWGWGLTSTGAGAWLPLAIFVPESDPSFSLPVDGVIVESYESTELTARAGETVVIFRQMSGWYWAEDEMGRRGWIPVICVELI